MKCLSASPRSTLTEGATSRRFPPPVQWGGDDTQSTEWLYELDFIMTSSDCNRASVGYKQDVLLLSLYEAQPWEGFCELLPKGCQEADLPAGKVFFFLMNGSSSL